MPQSVITEYILGVIFPLTLPHFPLVHDAVINAYATVTCQRLQLKIDLQVTGIHWMKSELIGICEMPGHLFQF